MYKVRLNRGDMKLTSLQYQGLLQAVQALAQGSEYQHLSPHDLLFFWGSELLRNGATFAHQTQAGHTFTFKGGKTPKIFLTFRRGGDPKEIVC